jgi:hypothetical protein
VAAASILVVALIPASAIAAGSSSAVMYSEPGDYIGLGIPRFYNTTNASFAITGNPNYLTVSVDTGVFGGDYFNFVFAAPDNEALAPGIYEGAMRAPFRDPGRPGIDIYGSGRGCNMIRGWFEVKDIAFGPTGVPERLWIVYEQICDNRPERLFGEVRVGTPLEGPVSARPDVVRWPTSFSGQPGLSVPVTVVANAPVKFVSTAIIGSDAAYFPISTENCTGRTLATGESCLVGLSFDSSASPGARRANLRLVDDQAVTYDVVLRGTSASPPTDLVVNQSSRFVIADWTLPSEPPGMLTGLLEFATDPTTDPDGFFTDPDSIVYQFDSNETTFDSAPDQFPPGTYYAHVSAFHPDTCDLSGYSCIDLFSAPTKIVVPPDPPPPVPPAATPSPVAASSDTVTSFSGLSVKASQKVGKLSVQASMGEAGTITAGGAVSVPNPSKVYRFKSISVTAVAGVSVTLKLKLPAKALKTVTKTLRKHKKLKARITITATDTAGNKKTETRTVKLKP